MIIKIFINGHFFVYSYLLKRYERRLKMISKKAQSEVITTVLIILLVLAAIIIVWQVVMGVLNSGKENVEAQSSCIGFSMAVTLGTDGKTVNIVPNKAVAGYRIYFNGANASSADSTAIAALSSASYTNVSVITNNTEISAAGKLGDTWCDGLNKVTKTK